VTFKYISKRRLLKDLTHDHRKNNLSQFLRLKERPSPKKILKRRVRIKNNFWYDKIKTETITKMKPSAGCSGWISEQRRHLFLTL
jgi:hypothetical protein